jgi:hypothetical protein
MDTSHFSDIQNDDVLRKRLAKKMAHDCFRNTTLENFHATGLIDDSEMKALMIDVVDHCYDFLMDLCSTHGNDIIENLKLRDELPEWNEPKLLAFRHF